MDIDTREDEESEAQPSPSDVRKFIMRVGASSVRIQAVEGGYHTGRPKAYTTSIITLEGTAEPSALRRVSQVQLTIFEGDDRYALGAAIGGRTVWNVVCYLKTPEFSNVLLLANTSRLHTVEMEFEKMERGCTGPLRSICFRTLPLANETLAEVDGVYIR